MGLFRLLLAFFVVIAHTYGGGLKIIDGSQAVRVFFIVSGFYMALILSEKYVTSRGTSLRLFYSNRAFRIFPLLWLVLALDVCLTLFASHFDSLPNKHWLSIAEKLARNGRFDLLGIYALTQVTALGVDVMHLFTISAKGTLHQYTGPAIGEEFRGWQPYPMSHVWSISCELVFYALAPALNILRTRTLLFWIALAVVANFMASSLLGAPLANAATSFLAPFQLGFFALGIVAYRIYKNPLVQNRFGNDLIQFLPVGLMLATILFYKLLLSFSYIGSLACLYGSVVFGIPFLFRWSRNRRWDRLLGDLSYPVYLVHITVIRVFDLPDLLKFLGPKFSTTFLCSVLVMTIAVLVSWILVQVFDKRIDTWRQRRANQRDTF